VRIQRLLGEVCGEAGPENPCAGLEPDGRALLVHNGDLHASMEHASSRVEQALAAATGIAVEATVPREVWAVGDTASVAVSVFNRGDVPVRISRRVLLPAGDGAPVTSGAPRVLAPDSTVRDSLRVTTTPPASQPWWLAVPRQGAMFTPPGSPADEGSRRSAPAVVTFFEVDAGRFAVFTTVMYRYADPIRGEVNLPAAAAPAITVTMDRDVEYAQADAPVQRPIRVHVRSHASVTRSVSVTLALPRGLLADTITRTVELRPGAQGTVSFNVRGRLSPGRHRVRATAESAGQQYTVGYQAVMYDHIRPQRLYRIAELAIEAVDVRLPAEARIAYINGVGDNSAPMLEQLGLDVTVLDPEALGRTSLSRFTAVVVGTRAYETSPALVANNTRLLEYARNGGTLVVQYGQYEMLAPGILPYPVTLARPADRVTVENSPVRIIDSTATVLTAPNRITERDFEGWVQDRSLYMPRTHDAAWRPVIAMQDPGAPANDGGILVARLGRGTYVYTTLAFFRQLPDGVPGAARLLVNLLAARAPGQAQ
jgi:hypothetical protein